jgi:transposase
MNYCGIDLGGVSSYAFVTDEQGRKLWSGPVETSQAAFEGLVKRFLPKGLSIAIEAGNQTAWVYEELVKLGATVVVVNPNQVRLIAESRRKTDKVDAKILCELLRIGGLPCPVHMPAPQARELRGLLVARRQLVSARAKICNVVRGMLRQTGVRLVARELSSKVGWQRLFHAGFEHDHLMHIVAAYYDTFLALTKSIHELDGKLAELEKNEPRATRLKTMPRVGRIAALTFLAAVDDVNRFPSSRKLVGYSGLAPTVRQSSERTQYGAISRQGRRELRVVWVQIAHLVARDTSKAAQPLRRWFDRVAGKRGKKTALVALARRLLVIAYQLLKTESDYDVSRLRKRRRAA